MPALALLGAFAVLFLGALRRWRDLEDGDTVLAQLILAGTIVTTLVASAFDVVLILAAPAFLAWAIIGVASGARKREGKQPVPDRALSWCLATMTIVVIASLARSATQALSMAAVGRGGRIAGWVEGAVWDPGSYRINVRLAEFKARRGNCAASRDYARRARALFPHAPEARRLAGGC